MNNKAVARTDPYLAGSIAARSCHQEQEVSAEQIADCLGLFSGDRRADFLRGWHAELAEREQERKEQLVTEYDAMAAGYEKGDPAAR
jgi:hypothetical protein